MNHGSLFSGFGGFDLAAEWMGWDNVFHCEIKDFPRKVLQYYWPKAKSYEDIKQTDFTVHRGQIDIITGGFPCQPYSQAGKRKGKEDDRHLWPEMLRAIRECQPTWIVGENVPGIISWNGGLVFEEVCADLENEGYEVQPIVLPAAAVGAPHRRDRVWFVAYSANTRIENLQFRGENGIYGFEATSDSDGNKRSEGGGLLQEQPETSKQYFGSCDPRTDGGAWQNFPTQSPICGGDDGIPSGLDGITFPKWRNESIKGFGNAVVPQVVYEIYKVIEKMEYEILNKY